MVKKICMLFMIILLISSVSAFSFEELLDINFIMGKSVLNRGPTVTLNRPADTQVVNNPVIFKWRYFDPEDDDMYYYILQIDDDPRFFSPVNYKGVGTEHRLTLEGGLYYWRVQAVNEFGGSFSDIWKFYVDPEAKICEDGTPYFECSNTRPNYCSAGILKNDCQRCGCSGLSSCQKDGSCLRLECVDGTAYGRCAVIKPFLCLDGELNEVCSVCGCKEGLVCALDEKCQLIETEVIVETEEEEILPRLSFLEKIAMFFKSLVLRE